MTNMPTKRLRGLRVHEISVVPVPAVPGAQIGLAKAADMLASIEKRALTAAITSGELREAIELAKSGKPAPRSFWRGALVRLAAEIAPELPPASAMHCAVRHPAGLELLKRLHATAT